MEFLLGLEICKLHIAFSAFEFYLHNNAVNMHIGFTVVRCDMNGIVDIIALSLMLSSGCAKRPHHRSMAGRRTFLSLLGPR